MSSFTFTHICICKLGGYCFQTQQNAWQSHLHDFCVSAAVCFKAGTKDTVKPGCDLQSGQFIPDLDLRLPRINPKICSTCTIPPPTPTRFPPLSHRRTQIGKQSTILGSTWAIWNPNCHESLRTTRWQTDPAVSNTVCRAISSRLLIILSLDLFFYFLWSALHFTPPLQFRVRCLLWVQLWISLCMPHFNNASLPSTQLQAVPYSSG